MFSKKPKHICVLEKIKYIIQNYKETINKYLTDERDQADLSDQINEEIKRITRIVEEVI